MKKSLLATTALAALGAAAVTSPASAEGFELKVGGFMEQWFGYTDNSNSTNPKYDLWDQHSDTEIHFLAKQTLDNGLTFGITIELEGEATDDGSSGPDEVDEQYMTVEGSFGKIIMGSEDTAAFLMHYTPKSNGAGIELSDFGHWSVGTTTALAYTGQSFGLQNDSNSVTYISPRVNGIQVGASFVPEQGDTDKRSPYSGSGESNGSRDNGFSVAANYETTVSDMSFKASLGYSDAGDDDATSITGDDTTLQGAIQLGFGGFTASFGYGERNKDNATAADVNVFATSLAYNAGPAGVSILYVRGEDSDADDKQNAVELGASYAVGPGVTAKGSVYVYDRKKAGTDMADGVAIQGGLVLNF